jgi:hypothetical protein
MFANIYHLAFSDAEDDGMNQHPSNLVIYINQNRPPRIETNGPKSYLPHGSEVTRSEAYD